jgi:hypothetical protein
MKPTHENQKARPEKSEKVQSFFFSLTDFPQFKEISTNRFCQKLLADFTLFGEKADDNLIGVASEYAFSKGGSPAR